MLAVFVAFPLKLFIKLRFEPWDRSRGGGQDGQKNQRLEDREPDAGVDQEFFHNDFVIGTFYRSSIVKVLTELPWIAANWVWNEASGFERTR
jgi:hypothetical protein